MPSTLLPSLGTRSREGGCGCANCCSNCCCFCFLADSLASQQRQPRCHASYALSITSLPPPLDIGRIGGVNRPAVEAGQSQSFQPRQLGDGALWEDAIDHSIDHSRAAKPSGRSCLGCLSLGRLSSRGKAHDRLLTRTMVLRCP